MKSSSTPPINPENDPAHSTNFCLALFYYCCLRIGWIFKTESIVMPAVLDVIGGSGWLRGCLPMLNRLGQSVPPFLASDLVRNRPTKKWILVGSSCTMGACFLVLSLIWTVTGGTATWYLPILFLVVYAIFFVATGINQLVVNTLIGKLIRVRRRGLLALIGTGLGALLAVVCAYFLLLRWLPPGDVPANAYRFDWIFGLTGSMFVIGGISAMFWIERPDENLPQARNPRQLLAASITSLKQDRNLMLLAIIAGLFGMSLTLFPHYQRLGRDRFDLDLTALIPWVLAQNIGAALFSVPAGWVADRLGTRLVLRIMLLIVCAAPMLALGLAKMPEAGQAAYTLVFGLLGITPVTMRIFNYYTLEISDRDDHPRYLSTLSLAMAAPPFFCSTIMGALVDRISFEFVFILVTACMLTGWILTFWLVEPRHHSKNLSA
jgi:MFS family permease